MKDIFDLLGRFFISLIFFYEAYDSIFYFKDTLLKMNEYGLTWHPKFFLYLSINFLVFGGILVLLGYRSKLGATLLLLYWIPLTLIVHSWWNDPEEIRRIQSILFMRNMAIAGGLLLLVVNGSQRYSVKRLFATTKVPGVG